MPVSRAIGIIFFLLIFYLLSLRIQHCRPNLGEGLHHPVHHALHLRHIMLDVPRIDDGFPLPVFQIGQAVECLYALVIVYADAFEIQAQQLNLFRYIRVIPAEITPPVPSLKDGIADKF